MAQQTDTEASIEIGSAWEDPLRGRTYRVVRTNGLEVVLEAPLTDDLDVRVVDARDFPGRYVRESQ